MSPQPYVEVTDVTGRHHRVAPRLPDDFEGGVGDALQVVLAAATRQDALADRRFLLVLDGGGSELLSLDHVVSVRLRDAVTSAPQRPTIGRAEIPSADVETKEEVHA